MTLTWKRCSICNGTGKLSILRTRINIFDKLLGKKVPLIDDETRKCNNCKGIGKVYIKINSIFNPWNPFRKDK